MRRMIFALTALALAACGKVAPEETPVAAAAPSFTIDDLSENDAQIQGCSRGLSRQGAPVSASMVFAEDAVDQGAKGFIRIDGALINVDLVSSTSSETGGARVFEDATQTTRILETLVTGAAHEEADSVEESGTLAVTHGGATQTLNVVGGTAC
jgi:predicted small lipoprotein YifL